MKIAVTIWGNRISPVFDASRTLLTAHIKNNVILEKDYTSIDPAIPLSLIKLLKKQKISVLVCGAISTKSADLIIENNIRLISFVTGNALKFLENFACKPSIEKKFLMPGCTEQSCDHYSSNIKSD